MQHKKIPEEPCEHGIAALERLPAGSRPSSFEQIEAA
jgi:hypothetical protein